MDVAFRYAELSHAKRLKVGALLVKDNRVLSIGYNGTPSGFDNDCEVKMDGILGQFPKEPNKLGSTLVTKPEVVHAEMNVIAFAAKNGVATNGCQMYITDSPCYECSKLIIQAGIKEVFYARKYRDESSFKFLEEGGVKVWQIV